MKGVDSIRKSVPILISVALLAVCFPPVGLPFLVFVAVAPWIASLRDTDGKGALRSSLTFGFLYILFQMFWIVPFVQDWTKKPLLALVPWLICGVLGSLLYAPLGWLIHQCWKQKLPWLIPIVWAGHEAFRAYVPGLAFPWGILANPLWMFPQFVQHAALGNVFLVSSWVMLPNLALAMILWPEKGPEGERLPPGPVVVRMALLFGGVMVLSTVRYGSYANLTKKVVTLGQPGVDLAYSQKDQRKRDLIDSGNLIQTRAVLQGTDLLVFPEGFSDDDPRVPPFSPLGEKPAVPVIMGGRRNEGKNVFQTAYAYDGKWSSVDKTRLVVFGEYVPFRNLPLLSGFNLPSGDLTPGKELKTLTVNKIVVGPLLCFEGVFPDLAEKHGRDGAQLLVQMCIDDWYERTPAWDQLWQSTVWRSIESGLPVVRVGGRGKSLATDSRGNVLLMVSKGKMSADRVEIGVPDRSDAFPYRMVFAYICWGVCGLVSIKAALPNKKPASQTSDKAS